MSSLAYQQFQENRKDIDTIWDIHQEYSGMGKKRGKRPPQVGVLNRAAFVFIAASWEAFIEDLMQESVEFLVTRGSDPAKMPPKLMGQIGSELKDKSDQKAAWELAGDGWKQLVTQKWAAAYTNWKEKFHSPKTENVEDYVFDCIGLKNIGSKWSWKNMSCKTAKNNLNEYLEVRGNIAHGIRIEGSISKQDASLFLRHVINLVEHSEKAVTVHLQNVTGIRPFEDRVAP